MPSSPTRLVAAALTLAAALAVIGITIEATRFGASERATAARLEAEVLGRFWHQARQVESLARRVARAGREIADAIESRDRLPALFNVLSQIGRPTSPAPISTTVYVPAGLAGEHRVLAWSDGPGEQVGGDRLTGPPSIFVAAGTAGLRLVFVHPVELDGRRIGVAAAETVLSSPGESGLSPSEYRIDTSFGPVTVIPQFAGAGEGPPLGDRFVITGADGVRLLEVRYSRDRLNQTRWMFRRQVAVVAAVPLVVVLLLLTGPVLDRRSRAARLPAWAAWSGLAAAMVVVAAVATTGLVRLGGVSPAAGSLIVAAMSLALVALLPVSGWWRNWGRQSPRQRPVRFVIEQLLAGFGLAAALLLLARLLHHRISPASLDRWQFPLFPIDPGGLLYLGNLLVIQIATCWAAAAGIAIVAARWRLTWKHPAIGLAILLWVAPVVAAAFVPHPLQPIPGVAALGAALALAVFGALATSLRRYYRRGTQALRFVLLFAALLLPPLLLYPMTAASADQAALALIEREYGPATAQHSQQLLQDLAVVRNEIDRIPSLADLVSIEPPATGPVPSQAAFRVWKQTSLARSRATSEIELFGAKRFVVSRFAVNLPEYPYRTGGRPWQGSSCSWEVFGEVVRFGAKERQLYHAERGVCDADGRLLGAIVVHMVPDFQALPFIPTANPYYDVVAEWQTGARAGSRLPDLSVVVYGWSLQPLFTSSSVGREAWPIAEDIRARLTQSREPFWISPGLRGRRYRVYFLNDRAGIYALGYPIPSFFQHLMRFAEVTAVVALIFVLVLLGAAVYAPFARRREAPLRVLFQEIRTSFYRKLFLFFVLAAIGPVLLFALAFGAYMTDKFRADVENEASSVVTVARRAFEELAAASRSPDQSQAVPTDDVMVWIRQVIDQDVNVFKGAELVATSQRDLFGSGLLPTRTPAAVYRAVALNRVPTVVAEDRIGSFEYRVAAAPVPALGPDAVMSVPLALRQREIDRQIDELNRGVLVGAVIVVLFAAGLGASVAGRVSDPVARLTRATRQIAAGRLDIHLAADTVDELGRLVEDFNTMTATLLAQRAELARTNQLKAWAEMARQVAHEIKNPLTPIQLAAEHLQRVHDDRHRPLGPAFDQCVSTILRQVRLLRQIASEFSTFAAHPSPRLTPVAVADLVEAVVSPYQPNLSPRITFAVSVPPELPDVVVDRTLAVRALTNLVENAVQAMPEGGRLDIAASDAGDAVTITFTDTGVGMSAEDMARAFEPYFSTKTGGSGLGLANARRNIELCGGTIAIDSTPGAGTTVTVTLPARQAAPASAAAGG